MSKANETIVKTKCEQCENTVKPVDLHRNIHCAGFYKEQ